jgi:hypothetical protein
MQFWNTHRFAAIGNLLGCFLEVDMSFENTGYMSVARILVRINLRQGLLQEITIDSAAGTFVQTLDYEGIPFWCHHCHVYDHGVADFPLPFKGSRSKAKGSGSPSPLRERTLEDQLDVGANKGSLKPPSVDLGLLKDHAQAVWVTWEEQFSRATCCRAKIFAFFGGTFFAVSRTYRVSLTGCLFNCFFSFYNCGFDGLAGKVWFLL